MEINSFAVAAANYFVITTIISLFLCGVYFSALKRLTFFKLNRAVLLSIPMMALLIPVFAPGADTGYENDNKPLIRTGSISSSSALYTAANTGERISKFLLMREIDKAEINSNPGFNFVFIFIAIYFAGCLLNFFMLAFALSKIYVLRKIAKPMIFKGERVFVINENFGSFSFFRSIYLAENILEADGAALILNHEREHRNGLHSLDLLFISVLKSIFWFNPALYLIERELRNIHEFIADNHTAINKKQYMSTLMEMTFDFPIVNLANSFHSNSLLTRIKMLKKNKTNRLWFANYFLLTPCLFLCLMFASCQKNANDIINNGKYHNFTISTELCDNRDITQTDSVERYFDEKNKEYIWKYKSPKVFAEPEIGWKAVRAKFEGNALMTDEARKADVQAVQINLSVEIRPNGTPTNYCYITSLNDKMQYSQGGVGYGLDQVAMNALKSLKWKPAMDSNDQPIATRVWFPLVIGNKEVFNSRF